MTCDHGAMTTMSDFSATTLSGYDQPLSAYDDKVALVVNTASKCGLTPQYEGPESLHQEFAGQGFTVLGFPCNQSAVQEPGSADQIQAFCEANYGVTFPMFAKVDINGKNAHPLFVRITSGTRGALGEAISWNFTKFLVGR